MVAEEDATMGTETGTAGSNHQSTCIEIWPESITIKTIFFPCS
jgi:hypothetical protein